MSFEGRSTIGTDGRQSARPPNSEWFLPSVRFECPFTGPFGRTNHLCIHLSCSAPNDHFIRADQSLSLSLSLSLSPRKRIVILNESTSRITLTNSFAAECCGSYARASRASALLFNRNAPSPSPPRCRQDHCPTSQTSRQCPPVRRSAAPTS